MCNLFHKAITLIFWEIRLIQKLGRLGFCNSTPFINTYVHFQLTNLQAHTVKQLAVVVIVIVVVYTTERKKGELIPFY